MQDFYERHPDAKDRDDLAKTFQLHNIRKRIEALDTDSTLLIDPKDPQWKELYDKHGMDFKELVRSAVMVLLQAVHQGVMVESTYKGVNIVLRTDISILIRDLRPELTDMPVTFDCTIISVDARKTYVKEAMYKCPICLGGESVKCNKERRIDLQMTKCKKNSCHRAQMILDSTSMDTDYIQTVIIQEPLEEAINNSPVTFVAKILGDQVGEAFISQKKRITGVFKSTIDIKKIEQDIYIDIIEMESLEEKKTITPTLQQIQKYEQQSSGKDWWSNLIESFAPHIFGYSDIKKSILLMLAGGVTTNKRADINLFLIGDPSMAKTELLKFGEKVTQKSAYATGKGVSGVGLTISIIKEENLGRYMAHAGVYPLCNGGYVFVDEFDKMSKDDRSAMHEVLEHGMCTVAKAGIKLSLPAKVATLAAANPQYGKYDSKLTVADNIDLPPTLLSRFDMIWLIRDKVNEFEDEKKARHVIQEFESMGTPYKCEFDCNELLSLVNYVKQLKPTLCPEARDKLLTMYRKMRKAAEKHDTVPVGIRQLEALIRLSMAHAKWGFKKVVEVEDIDEVIRLYKASFLSYGIDLEEGTLGNALIEDFTKMNKEQAFWHAWKDEEKNGEIDPVILTQRLSGTKNFQTDEDVAKMLNSLEHKENRIMRTKSGRLAKA